MSHSSRSEQLATFYVGPDLFGIEAMRVQEVTGKLSLNPVPLAPQFIKGLVNLRGQIAIALGLRELFQKDNQQPEPMSVVCKMDGNLVSLIVDSVGDVIEFDRKCFEIAPETLPPEVRRFIKGIYKMNNTFLSVLDLEILAQELTKEEEFGL